MDFSMRYLLHASNRATKRRGTGLNLKSESAAAALGELWPHLPNMQMLDVSWCEMRPAAMPLLLDSPQHPRLHKLRVLDLRANSLSDRGLRQLAARLDSLPNLQALSVANCYCQDVDTLLHLTTSLPPSLTHLNVRNSCGAAMVQITQQKERLAKLHHLNIGDGDDTNRERALEATRQEMTVLNPDIHDYRDINCEETVEAIRQELLVFNPDINVYCNIESL